MKSISINDIATNLNTSRNTVSKVLNSRGYVSDSLKKRIVIEAVEKGYKNISPELLEYYYSLGNTAYPSEHDIAVIAASPETSPYWTQIIAGISGEVNATLHHLYFHFITEEQTQNFSMPEFMLSDQIDALILLNIHNPEMIRQIAELPLAKIYLDLPSENLRQSVRGDILLPDGENCIYEITTHYITKKHCQYPVFVGDISGSRAVYERLLGFCQALSENHMSFDRDSHLLNIPSYESLPEFLGNYLITQSHLPDLFVCESDLAAYTLYQIVKEKMPESLSSAMITGYGNFPLLGVSKPFLTSVNIDTHVLSKKLVQQLLWRLDNPEMPYEIIHLSTGIVFRS